VSNTLTKLYWIWSALQSQDVCVQHKCRIFTADIIPGTHLKKAHVVQELSHKADDASTCDELLSNIIVHN